MNLSCDIGRKSGFSYESKRYFDEAKYPWRFCAGKIWRETKGKSRGPFYVGPNQRNVCESAEENVSWKYLRSKLLCVFLYVLGEKESIGSGLLRANLAQNHKTHPPLPFMIFARRRLLVCPRAGRSCPDSRERSRISIGSSFVRERHVWTVAH